MRDSLPFHEELTTFICQEEEGVEQEWLNAFSEEEFADLKLSGYFPKVYRGLPRLYQRDHPKNFYIKKNFSDLNELKKQTIDKALCSLYERIELKTSMKVTLFAWIIPDGLGDWVAVQETAALLLEKIPLLDVQLIFLTPRKLPSSKSFPTQEIYYEKEPSMADFPLAALKTLRESHLILQIPTFFSQSEDLWKAVYSLPSDHPNPQIENIGEYGYLESSWFHPKSQNRSMGLHALEKGIFIRKSSPCSFADLEQKNLCQWLFGKEIPHQNEIQTYETTHRFFLSYLTTPQGGAIYLQSLLKMLENDPKDIDLCSPDLGWLIRWIQERQESGLPLLDDTTGLKEINILAFEMEHRLQLSHEGKTLRILNPGPISHSDMQKLFFLSGDWVGVRGDQSFTEAVSAGKPFFYDGRDHARYFIKDLIALAENRLTQFPSTLRAFQLMKQAFLWTLPEVSEDWVDEDHFQQTTKLPWTQIAKELGQCLKDPTTSLGFKEFCRVIATEHSFNAFLCNLVKKSLFHTLHPELHQTHTEQLTLYLDGKISLTTLITDLRARLQA